MWEQFVIFSVALTAGAALGWLGLWYWEAHQARRVRRAAWRAYWELYRPSADDQNGTVAPLHGKSPRLGTPRGESEIPDAFMKIFNKDKADE